MMEEEALDGAAVEVCTQVSPRGWRSTASDSIGAGMCGIAQLPTSTHRDFKRKSVVQVEDNPAAGTQVYLIRANSSLGKLI